MTKKKDKDKFKYKAFSILLNLDKEQTKIFDFMCEISKNVVNCTLFCNTIYYRYISMIFADLQKEIVTEHLHGIECTNKKRYKELNKVVNSRTQELFLDIFGKYYIHYCDIKQQLFDNTNEIYKSANKVFGFEPLNDGTYTVFPIVNDTYNVCKTMLYHETRDICDKCPIELRKELYYDIVENNLKTFYNKNYFTIVEQIKNKIPCNLKVRGKVLEKNFLVENFIEQVKHKEYILPPYNPTNYRKQIRTLFGLEVTSAKSIIRTITKAHLGDNEDKLPCENVNEIIKKVAEMFSSFYTKRSKGMPCKKPKYLKATDKFNIFFSTNCLIMESDCNIRLAIGKYVGKNYATIIGNTKLIKLPTMSTKQHTFYIHEKYLKQMPENKRSISKKDNCIIGDKFIPKSSKYIINASFLSINISNKLNDKTITRAEIVPLYNGYQYKLQIIYLRPTPIRSVENIENNSRQNVSSENNEHIDNTNTSNNFISIDLGLRNLMVIYDPNGYQYIIRGGYIISLNNYFNEKIDAYKSKIKKSNNLDTCKEIRRLLVKRENKINDYFNKLVKYLLELYSDKQLIIIGKNINWKKGCNLGRKNNRDFYMVPFNKLINKFIDKAYDRKIKVEITEESYTSKCDALGKEDVCKHGTYMGSRIIRGLFSSHVGKYINADLNGAINIARKYMLKNETPLTEITGIGLFNPIAIRLEVFNR